MCEIQRVCTHLRINFQGLTHGKQAEVKGGEKKQRRCAAEQVKCTERRGRGERRLGSTAGGLLSSASNCGGGGSHRSGPH